MRSRCFSARRWRPTSARAVDKVVGAVRALISLPALRVQIPQVCSQSRGESGERRVSECFISRPRIRTIAKKSCWPTLQSLRWHARVEQESLNTPPLLTLASAGREYCQLYFQFWIFILNFSVFHVSIFFGSLSNFLIFDASPAHKRLRIYFRRTNSVFVSMLCLNIFKFVTSFRLFSDGS